MMRNGALAGMVIGALTMLLWKNYGYTEPYEIIPGFIFARSAPELLLTGRCRSG